MRREVDGNVSDDLAEKLINRLKKSSSEYLDFQKNLSMPISYFLRE